MILKNETNPTGIRIAPDVLMQCSLQAGCVEARLMGNGLLLTRGALTAQEILLLVNDLHQSQEQFLDSIEEICGPCEESCTKDCPLQAHASCWLPEILLEQAGIPANARLHAVADPEDGTILVMEAGEDAFDLPGSLSPKLVSLLTNKGLCMRNLSRLINSGEVVYDCE